MYVVVSAAAIPRAVIMEYPAHSCSNATLFAFAVGITLPMTDDNSATVTLPGVAGFNDEVSAMVNSTGAAQAAYQKMMETTEEKIKKAKTALSNLGIVLGDTFLPYVTTAAEKLSVLITNFSAWAQENPKLLSTLVKVGGAVLGLKAAGYRKTL